KILHHLVGIVVCPPHLLCILESYAISTARVCDRISGLGGRRAFSVQESRLGQRSLRADKQEHNGWICALCSGA
ncbi:hypothetical protein K438DRAFT_1822443, partial [Mycena galopus ATCC 62051]